MECPSCQSDNVRRSRRRGLREGTTLRLKNQAPYRCRDCGYRFIAPADEATLAAASRHLTFADYLGLHGWARKLFSDQVVLGLLAFLAMLLLGMVVVALSLGWFDPLLSRSTTPAWTPGASE